MKSYRGGLGGLRGNGILRDGSGEVFHERRLRGRVMITVLEYGEYGNKSEKGEMVKTGYGGMDVQDG